MCSSAPGHDPRARLWDPKLAGDRRRRRRVVAGDHHGADCARLATVHGVLHLRARRIDHADKPQEDKLVLDAYRQLGRGSRVRLEAQGSGRDTAAGDCKRAQGLPGELVVALCERGAALVVERDDPALLPHEPALREQDLGRALDEDLEVARGLIREMDGGVALALRGEGDFRNAREARKLSLGQAELARRDQQGALGRIALHRPAPLARGERGVVGERRRAQRSRYDLADRRGFGERGPRDGEAAGGDITTALDLDQLARGKQRAHRHLVASQRAGLVGADDGRGTERLDRRQLAHDSMGGRHAAHTEAQSNGDDRRQRFRYSGDRERDREQEQAQHGVERHHRAGDEPGGEHQRADQEHGDGEPLAGGVELLLERRRLPLGGFEQSGDAADLGLRAGRDHHSAAATIGGDGSGEQHVVTVADAAIGLDRQRVLRHRDALAGQGCLVGLEVGALDDPRVGRDLIASLDQNDVARNDFMGRDALALARANDRRFRSCNVHQCAHRFFGPCLLHEAENGVQGDDRQDDDRLVRERGLARILQQPFDDRNDHGDEQDDDQKIYELIEQATPPGRLRRAFERIRSVECDPPLRLGAAQAVNGVSADLRGDGIRRSRVRSHRKAWHIVLGG